MLADESIMCQKLIGILWHKGIISNQDYENLYFCENAKDLSDSKNKIYADAIEKARKENK